MHPLVAISLPPIGVAIASGLDFEAVEKLAKFTEDHPGFCVAVCFLWLIRSGLQLWVMKQHKSNATASAMLSLIDQAGGLPDLVSKAIGAGLKGNEQTIDSGGVKV